MPSNPFKSKPGSKKLNSPTSTCPLTKAQIRIEVYSYDPRNPGNRQPIEGVKLSLTGPTATDPSKTPGSGQWRYQPLAAGAYTVTATFPPDIGEKYDVTVPTAAAQAKNLVPGDDQTALFLVPSTWVEFVVKDTAGQTLPNIAWQLERQPQNGGAFAQYDKGATGADGKTLRLDCKTGAHRFTVQTLTNPQWSATEAVIGKEIVLSATAEGFQSDDAGVFEILDGYDVNTVLLTVSGSVKERLGAMVLEAKWKPAEGPFANFKHSRIIFRAKAGPAAVAYSAPESLLKEEKIKFDDNKGKTVDQNVELFFSGGTHKTFTTAKGAFNAQIPWGETLLAVKFPGLAKGRVGVDPGVNAGAVAV